MIKNIGINEALKLGVKAHKVGNLNEADKYYTAILKAHPNHPQANHNMGILAVSVGKVSEALPFFRAALEANSEIGQFWISYIDALIKLERVNDAHAIFKDAIEKGIQGQGLSELEKIFSSLKNKSHKAVNKTQDPPQNSIQTLLKFYNELKLKEALQLATELLVKYNNSAILHNIQGAIHVKLTNTDAAIVSYKKAISLQSDFPDAHNNLGSALHDKRRLEKAIEAYRAAISLKPEYAEAYNNLGVALQEKGSFKEAVRAFEEAISIKPIYVDAHRNLSAIKKYHKGEKQFILAQDLYNSAHLSQKDRCSLNFALAKMYEDIGEFDKAFGHLYEGNQIRKKVLNYSIDRDKKIFANLRKMQLKLPAYFLKEISFKNEIIPIFIVGMPRSGTTLVEQIISSHSRVTGAGELDYLARFGKDLINGSTIPNEQNITVFRNKYLSKLKEIPNRTLFISDKMPQNFYYIPLICTAFPEAKIVHVERNSEATCWSNFRHYFSSDLLGYCYDLDDTVHYYHLYTKLMECWKINYNDRIFTLNYDKLTHAQEKIIRDLIKYLDLAWEGSCLSPQENTRNVSTASSLQVRKKIYTDSSKVWLRYKPFIKNSFASLKQ